MSAVENLKLKVSDTDQGHWISERDGLTQMLEHLLGNSLSIDLSVGGGRLGSHLY